MCLNVMEGNIFLKLLQFKKKTIEETEECVSSYCWKCTEQLAVQWDIKCSVWE